MAIVKPCRFCGRDFSAEELFLIRDVVQSCKGLSRTEIAHTISELLDWKRLGDRLKGRECMELLDRLAGEGLFELPRSRTKGSPGPRRSVSATVQTLACALSGRVEEYTPLEVVLAENCDQRKLFRDLLSRYHYLGYAMPFGARLQYLVYVSRPRREVVACVQFSSPAWRMKVRDQWIGWDDKTRSTKLQHVVNNSRLLVIPRVRNLASKTLSVVFKHLRKDWQRHYFIEPWLAETFVDQSRFYGGCYRAANWTLLGQTSGRGRMDSSNKLQGTKVKTVLVRELVKNATHRLRQGV